MGLDITARRRLVLAAPGEGLHSKYPDDVDSEQGYVRLYVNGDFPTRAADVQDRAIYRAEETIGFRAGSYSGYNTWRDQLAHLAHGVSAATVWGQPEKYGAFVEIINFSDCEGVIGAAVSAKLAADFAAHQEQADAHTDGYFREKYAEWRRAFEMAADGGAVEFH